MMKRRIKWIALAALVVVVIGGTVVFVVRGRGGGTEVETVNVRRETLSSVVSASGDLAPLKPRDVSPQVAGTIADLPVQDGQKVVAGQLLVRLDSRPYRVAASQAWAAYEAAIAQRDTVLKTAPGGCELRAARAAVDQSHFAYTVARYAWRTAPPAQKTPTKMAMDQAYVAYLQAKANLQKMENGTVLGAQLSSADAAIDSAYRAYSKALVDVAHCEVFAPISGTLLFKVQTNPLSGEQSKPGEGTGVTAGSPVVSVANLRRMEFVADVDETDVSKVRSGQKVTVTLDAYPNEEYAGRVIQVAASAVTAKSGGTSFPVRIRLGRVKQILRIGMNGSADIIRAQAKDVLVVPYEAVASQNGAQVVFVVKNDVVEQRTVTLGLATDTLYQVKDGLTEGEKIVRTKVSTLKDGQQVTVK